MLHGVQFLKHVVEGRVILGAVVTMRGRRSNAGSVAMPGNPRETKVRRGTQRPAYVVPTQRQRQPS